MRRRAQIFAGTAREFLKSFWILCIVLILIVGSTAYMMIRFYRASILLVEANRKSFLQRAQAGTAVLESFLVQRLIDIETISGSQILNLTTRIEPLECPRSTASLFPWQQ